MFSSRLLLNLGLIALLAILIGLALFNDADEQQTSAFSALKKTDIVSIQIERKGVVIEITKSDNIWHIQKPLTVEADEFRVHSILSILTAAGNNYYEINQVDYHKFSLDSPLASLKLNQQTFLFGSTSSVNYKRYVLTNNKLFLISDTIYPLIAAGFKNIMRRQLFASNINLTKIEYDNTSIFKNEQRSWEEKNQDSSADELKKFVDNWQYIQSYAVSDAATPYQGTKVTFTINDKDTTVLLIQKTDINTVVINPQLGLSYQFDITAFESLTNTHHYRSDKE